MGYRFFVLSIAHCLLPVFLELPQKPYIIFKKHSYIINAVFKHCNALYAKTECKTGIPFRVIINGLKNHWVNHACAKYLKPAAPFAHTAPFAVAHNTLNIHFYARLCKRKKTWPETNSYIFSK